MLEDSVAAWAEATGSEGWMGGEEEGVGSVQVRSSLKTDQGQKEQNVQERVIR